MAIVRVLRVKPRHCQHTDIGWGRKAKYNSRISSLCCLLGCGFSVCSSLGLGLLCNRFGCGGGGVLLLGSTSLDVVRCNVGRKCSQKGQRTLDAGFLEPARDTGFFAVDGGFADTLEAGFALAAREAGLADPARDAFDTGFAPAALLAGLFPALDAGLA